MRLKQGDTREKIVKYEDSIKDLENEVHSLKIELDSQDRSYQRWKKDMEVRLREKDEAIAKEFVKKEEEVVKRMTADMYLMDVQLNQKTEELAKLRAEMTTNIGIELQNKEEEMKEKYKTWDREMHRLVQTLEEELDKKDAKMEKVRPTRHNQYE